jgi:hypothetical protein
MSYIIDHKQKFTDLKFHIENQDQLKRAANGGKSILFSFPPEEEQLYIEYAMKHYCDQAYFIDVSKLFIDFIDEDGWEAFEDFYNSMETSPHKVFYDKEAKETDLFDMIIDEIEHACNNDKIPFLIRTGCLYGTGIENVNIMEHKSVMELKHALVIFYPASIENDNIYFLNFKPASKYRCVLVK